MPSSAIVRALLLVLLAASLSAFAQGQKYTDATTQLNAAGLFKIRLRNVEYLRSECTTFFPEKTHDFAALVTAWQAADAVPIAKTEELWPKLLAREPKVEAAVTRVTNATAFSIALMKELEPNGERTLLLGFCVRQIADGTSAAWRTRTPEIYRLLEDQE